MSLRDNVFINIGKDKMENAEMHGHAPKVNFGMQNKQRQFMNSLKYGMNCLKYEVMSE